MFVAAMFACGSNAVQRDGLSQDACTFDKPAMLALDEQKFDQDLSVGGGGWRALASRQTCELAAADLIADYRSAHGSVSPLLFWHEGQLRAFSGQYTQAIALLQQSYKPRQQDFGWNAYADATIAFLRGDRLALDAALVEMKATPAPPGETLKEGKLEMTLPDGTKTTMPWPLNVEVVEGLQRCLGKPYREAYGPACRRED